jgi:hypothetical protein
VDSRGVAGVLHGPGSAGMEKKQQESVPPHKCSAISFLKGELNMNGKYPGKSIPIQ